MTIALIIEEEEVWPISYPIHKCAMRVAPKLEKPTNECQHGNTPQQQQQINNLKSGKIAHNCLTKAIPIPNDLRANVHSFYPI